MHIYKFCKMINISEKGFKEPNVCLTKKKKIKNDMPIWKFENLQYL